MEFLSLDFPQLQCLIFLKFLCLFHGRLLPEITSLELYFFFILAALVLKHSPGLSGQSSFSEPLKKINCNSLFC